MKWETKMTDKKKRFVEEYLIDLNQTQSAIRAGYSPLSAKDTATRLMKDKEIKKAIAQAMAKRSVRTGISQDRVLEELAKIAFVNPSDLLDFQNGGLLKTATREDTACISSVKIKEYCGENGSGSEKEIGMYNKLKALELLGKHLGMFDDRLRDIDNTINININGDFDEC